MMQSSNSPVSQQFPSPTTPGGGGQASTTSSVPVDGGDEPVDLQKALFREEQICTETILHDEHGPGARLPIPLKSPRARTPAEKAKHDLTHMPPHE